MVYAHNADAPQHESARRWVQRLFPRPLTAEEALRAVGEWLALPNVRLIDPGPRHLELVEDLVVRGQAGGPLVTDAALAALAIESGATLASTDQDFTRFPGLRWVNPLAVPTR